MEYSGDQDERSRHSDEKQRISPSKFHQSLACEINILDLTWDILLLCRHSTKKLHKQMLGRAVLASGGRPAAVIKVLLKGIYPVEGCFYLFRRLGGAFLSILRWQEGQSWVGDDEWRNHRLVKSPVIGVQELKALNMVWLIYITLMYWINVAVYWPSKAAKVC